MENEKNARVHWTRLTAGEVGSYIFQLSLAAIFEIEQTVGLVRLSCFDHFSVLSGLLRFMQLK